MTPLQHLKRWSRNFAPELIDFSQRAIGKSDKTYADEYKTLEGILEILGEPKKFRFIDVGAGDGYNMSIAWPLMLLHQARGLLIEPDLEQLNKAKKLYKRSIGFTFSSERLTPETVAHVISESKFEDFFYLKIDIDSYDLDILEAVIKASIRPRLFSIEINELFPPPVRFKVAYRENYSSCDKPLYGCSLQSAFDFATANGYFLHSLAYNNAFFVSEEFLPLFPKLIPQSPLQAYRSGYVNGNWKLLFPWNVKYEHWLQLTPEDFILEIEKLPQFNKEHFFLSL